MLIHGCGLGGNVCPKIEMQAKRLEYNHNRIQTHFWQGWIEHTVDEFPVIYHSALPKN
jgi:hypothetical protein